MTSRWLDTTDAALNAVLGDYLEKRGSVLSTEMAFYHGGRPLSLSARALENAGLASSPRIVILVHGMAQTEACWSFPDDVRRSYGALLREDFGLSPFHLRYNTGRRIAQNGRDLAALLDELLEALPVSVDDITLIGHSLGGLLIRSACHYAAELGLPWIHRARRAFYLGSPHLGAPLEKGGRLLSVALGSIDHPVTRLIHSVAELRSAGVKDLRYGQIVDAQGRAAFADIRLPSPAWVPLGPEIDHYFVAGTLAKHENHLISRLFGDSLVRIPSAMASAQQDGLRGTHSAVVPGAHHMMLAHSPEVYARIRDWLAIDNGRSVAKVSLPARATQTSATKRTSGRRILDRVDAYRELLVDGVHLGATAIQDVHEALTLRPYHWMGLLAPLKTPTEIASSLHLTVIRTTYDSIRLINRLASTVSHESIRWLTMRTAADDAATGEALDRGASPEPQARRGATESV
jgi:triacylglycerol lipase